MTSCVTYVYSHMRKRPISDPVDAVFAAVTPSRSHHPTDPASSVPPTPTDPISPMRIRVMSGSPGRRSRHNSISSEASLMSSETSIDSTDTAAGRPTVVTGKPPPPATLPKPKISARASQGAAAGHKTIVTLDRVLKENSAQRAAKRRAQDSPRPKTATPSKTRTSTTPTKGHASGTPSKTAHGSRGSRTPGARPSHVARQQRRTPTKAASPALAKLQGLDSEDPNDSFYS